MRIPWFSFGAVAILAAIATAELSTRNRFADVGVGARESAASDTVERTIGRSGKHGAAVPPALPLTPIAAEEPPHLGAPLTLIIPVAGVARSQLTDTWGAARAEGRVHEGIDILAPQGAPVLAAADGRIVKFFDSARGGLTIYQFDASERFVYYYAHLLARAPGLAEGFQAHQGQVIGYVGMTGNAPTPHLHFEVERLGPERHWWQAQSINPYPLLMAGQAPSA
jgi:peptidoglycan LD-endopeptidase LytH